MPNCNNNGCFSGSYYPRQIFTCRCGGGCGGSGSGIVNPQPVNQWAFLTLSNSIQINQNGEISFETTDKSGTAVSNNNGVIDLTAGTYEISYNARAVVPNSGVVSIAVSQNGEILTYSTSTQTGSQNNVMTLSNSIIITSTTNFSIRILNIGDATTFDSANATIVKVP